MRINLAAFALPLLAGAADHEKVAESQMRRICDQYAWVNCTSGFLSGSFGGGHVAVLQNDPRSTGVQIYRNCPAIPGDKDGVMGQCTEEHLVSPAKEPQVHVFLKTVFPITEEGGLVDLGYQLEDAVGNPLDGPDAEQLERLRARAMASNPAHVAVDQLDLFLYGRDPPVPHDLLSKHRLIITGAVFGPSFYGGTRFPPGWRDSMTRALERWAAGKRHEMERLNAVLIAETVWPLLYYALAWRARLQMLQRMREHNLFHCDAHSSNIMFHGTTVPVDDPVALQSAERLFRAGRVRPVLADESRAVVWALPWAEELAPVLRDGAKLKLVGLAGADIVAIDTAYSLVLSQRDVDAAGGKSLVNGPCATWRAQRCEDIGQLWREVPLWREYETAVDTLFERVRRFAEDSRQDSAVIEALSEAATRANAAAGGYVSTMLEGIPELVSCVNFGYTMDWKTQIAANKFGKNRKWARGRRLFANYFANGARCDIAMMDSASDALLGAMDQLVASLEPILRPAGFKFQLAGKYKPGIRGYLTYKDGRSIDFAQIPVKMGGREASNGGARSADVAAPGRRRLHGRGAAGEGDRGATFSVARVRKRNRPRGPG